MAQQEDVFKKIVSHCKEYGFVFPSSEIYDGLGAVYDYGQNGVELKNNIKQYWWKSMVQLHDNIVGLDAAIFMHPTTWKASGHVDAFNDPLIDNRDSKKRYRADVLIEDQIAKYEEKIEKEVEKARKRFGEAFDEAQFRSTNARVLEHQQKRDTLHERYSKAMNANDLAELRQIILDEEIACPISGTRNWTEVRQFNLMFSTEVGSTADGASKIYLRPETAQGIFVNFKNVMRTTRRKLPIGICDIGKAFRNEITPGNFTFRMREFEQMEIEFFFKPGEDEKWFEFYKENCKSFVEKLGLKDEKVRFRDHEPAELAFYSKATTDIEYDFPTLGWGELMGIACRSDYDLGRHQETSKEDLTYLDSETNERYLPHVVEPSFGLDRLMLALCCDAYDVESLNDGKDSRVVMHFAPELAPYTVAVMPLSNKLNEEAKKVFDMVHEEVDALFDTTGSIGKRYRREDAIGTPLCVTFDFQSLEDHMVTVRERDSMSQERVKIDELNSYIHNFLAKNRVR